MHGVLTPPLVVGREGDDAGDEPDDIVGLLGTEEGPVAAVVEDDEGADEQAGGEHSRHQQVHSHINQETS